MPDLQIHLNLIYCSTTVKETLMLNMPNYEWGVANLHLVLLHVSDSPACACGLDVEDCNHYLLECSIFYVERQTVLQAISLILDIQNLHEDTLLFWSDNCNLESNKAILNALHKFIRDNNRL